MEYTNASIEVKDNKITITIDASKSFGPSKSGKSIIVATTNGNVPIPVHNGTIMLGLNAYKTKGY